MAVDLGLREKYFGGLDVGEPVAHSSTLITIDVRRAFGQNMHERLRNHIEAVGNMLFLLCCFIGHTLRDYLFFGQVTSSLEVRLECRYL